MREEGNRVNKPRACKRFSPTILKAGSFGTKAIDLTDYCISLLEWAWNEADITFISGTTSSAMVTSGGCNSKIAQGSRRSTCDGDDDD